MQVSERLRYAGYQRDVSFDHNIALPSTIAIKIRPLSSLDVPIVYKAYKTIKSLSGVGYSRSDSFGDCSQHLVLGSSKVIGETRRTRVGASPFLMPCSPWPNDTVLWRLDTGGGLASVSC